MLISCVIFAHLCCCTGGGLKKALKRKGTGEKRNLEESALGIVAQLCCWLGQDSSSGGGSGEEDRAYPLRLLNKLTEHEYEKLERCAELYGKTGASCCCAIVVCVTRGGL